MNAKNIDKATNCYKTLIVLQDFQNIKTKSTVLLNFHKVAITALKQTFQRFLPKKLFIGATKNLIGLFSKES